VDGSVAFRRTGEGPDYGIECFRAALADVARETRCLPHDFINDAGNDIHESFRTYVGPLAGDLPDVARL